MNNIFDTIKGSIPKPIEPVQTQPVQRAGLPAKKSNKDLVVEWQHNPTPELTAEVLSRLRSTLDGGIASFAGGARNMEIKAAKLALEALKKYDPGFGVEPSTYVFNNLRRLTRYSAQRSSIINQSEAVALDNKKLREASLRFQEDHDRQPSLEELADITGFSRKKIERLSQGTAVINESSTLTENRKDTVTKDKLTDDDYFEYVYSSVGPIDQKIMEWVAGKHRNPTLSNNEIAHRLKISPAAVSQRKARLQTLLSEVRGLL